MSASLERKLLIFIAVMCTAIAVSALVLAFRMKDTADDLADAALGVVQRAHINRYLICQAIGAMNVRQPLCDDIDPPETAHPPVPDKKRTNRI